MVKEHAPKEIKKVLFGNKIDLEKKVKYTEAQVYAKNQKMEYLETSAKSGENVEKAFLQFAKTLQV